ncbi:MAG: hypothetical protein JXQ85_14665 [Cognatishimia sp.]|uniref:hypothetical protein n=1 Tax=Cognatishimia sp. TaxID=2211648 RepID=UPI003B8B79F0
MIDAKTLNSDIQQVLKLIERQFGIVADDLGPAMRKIGRRLPKSAHRNAKLLLDAQSKADHPKIAMQIDEASLKTPYNALIEAIEGYDRKDALKGQVLDILATTVFNLLCLAGIIALAVYLVNTR